MKTKDHISNIIAIFFLILFAYTGASKVIDHSVFKEEIELSPLLRPFALFLVWLVPLLEFSAAILLLLPKFRRQGFWTAFILMTTFTLYLAVITIFFEDIPCSCGGVVEQLSPRWHLIFDAALSLFSFLGLLISNSNQKYVPPRTQ